MSVKSKDNSRTIVRADDLFPIIEEVLNHKGLAKFTVYGSSMWPWICSKRDSVIVEHALLAQIRRGDIVLLHLPDNRWRLHRVSSISSDSVVTIGDGNLYYDPPVQSSCIKARVVCIERPHGRILCQRFFWLLLGRFWLDLFPIRNLLLCGGRRLYYLLHPLRNRN